MSDSQNKLMEPEFNLSGFVDYRKKRASNIENNMRIDNYINLP